MNWNAWMGAGARGLVVLSLIGSIACVDDGGKSARSTDDDFPTVDDVQDGSVSLVSAEFFVDKDNRFFTYLAHLMGRTLGEVPLHFVNDITLKNESSDSQTVFVEASIQGYSETARQRVDLGPNETKSVEPMDLTFKYNELYGVTSAVTANAQVSVYQGEKLVDLRTETISIDPVNRVRWFIEDEGELLDMRPFAAALVTPEDRGNEIQKLLTDAAKHADSGAILGYQGGTLESAADQARAVFNALKDRGMVYASVGGSFFDGAQNVKLPAQSLTTGSANCIDGALVFASAFEAMEMEPFLVFMTGHALVGVRLAQGDDESIIFIETTMIGSGSFEDAVEAGHRAIVQRIEQGDELLMDIDVVAARRLGITPVNL